MIKWLTGKSNRHIFDPGKGSLEDFLGELTVTRPYRDWVSCWARILVACQKNEDGTIQHPLFIGEPATEREVTRIEEKVERKLPHELRDIFLNFSSRFGFQWKSSSVVKLTDDVQLSRIWGGFYEIRLEDLPVLSEVLRSSIKELEKFGDEELNHLLEIDRNALPFYGIGNGDMLAVDLRRERGNIIYLAHESGPDYHGISLGRSFFDFMNKWSQLGCIGPEVWLIEPFLTEHGFTLETRVSKIWQRWMKLIC